MVHGVAGEELLALLARLLDERAERREHLGRAGGRWLAERVLQHVLVLPQVPEPITRHDERHLRELPRHVEEVNAAHLQP